MRRRMTGSTPNKALELTAVAWGNVAVFHVCTRFAGLPFVVGGSSAGAFGSVADLHHGVQLVNIRYTVVRYPLVSAQVRSC